MECINAASETPLRSLLGRPTGYVRKWLQHPFGLGQCGGIRRLGRRRRPPLFARQRIGVTDAPVVDAADPTVQRRRRIGGQRRGSTGKKGSVVDEVVGAAASATAQRRGGIGVGSVGVRDEVAGAGVGCGDDAWEFVLGDGGVRSFRRRIADGFRLARSHATPDDEDPYERRHNDAADDTDHRHAEQFGRLQRPPPTRDRLFRRFRSARRRNRCSIPQHRRVRFWKTVVVKLDFGVY